MPSTNVTCTANWNVNTINLRWMDDDQSTQLSTGTCTYGAAVGENGQLVPYTPTKPGYTFTGWTVYDHQM